MAAAASAVQINVRKTLGIAAYLGSLTAVSAVLFVLTWWLDWGFYGWGIGAFFLFAGGAGLFGMLKQGGAGSFACPSCGHAIDVLQTKEHRTAPCPHCGTWLEGSAQITRVPADRVVGDKDGHPFLAPLRDGAEWPMRCPLCEAPATRLVVVEGAPGAAGAVVASAVVGVGVYKSYKVQVPACAVHDKPGVEISRVSDPDATIGVTFRSIRYWRGFCQANHLDETQAAVWYGIAEAKSASTAA